MNEKNFYFLKDVREEFYHCRVVHEGHEPRQGKKGFSVMENVPTTEAKIPKAIYLIAVIKMLLSTCTFEG